MIKNVLKWGLVALVGFFLAACGVLQTPEEIETPAEEQAVTEGTETDPTADFQVEEGEPYDTAEEVAAYLELYGELPVNYLTKEEARELGWEASAGNLWDVAPGASIGGDYFGNFEGLLPEEGDYREADIEYDGGYRNAKRLVYSADGYYYYTDDHYASFEEIEVGDEAE